MKKITILLFVLLCVCLAACVKSETANNKQTAKAYADLKTSVIALNSDLSTGEIAISVTRGNELPPYEPPVIQQSRWWKWIIVGIADIGGALCKPRPLFGSKKAGRVNRGVGWSMLAASFFDKVGWAAVSPDKNQYTDYWYESATKVSTDKEQEGYYHNLIIHEIWSKYGNSIYTMSQAEIINVVADQTEIYFGEDSLSDFESEQSAYLEQANQFLNIIQRHETYDAFLIEEIKNFMPEQSEQWDIVKVYIEGLANVTNLQEYDWYFTSMLNLIDTSSIPIDAKKELESAVSIGTASYSLWSIKDTIIYEE